VAVSRQAVRRIVHGDDGRLLVIVGPCSVHDPRAALEYAGRLATERRRHADELEIVMRVYFEKPRTTVGWKGLINDPDLDGSFRIHEGLRIARNLLLDINRLGLPAAGELLDTLSPQYLSDLLSWGAIGARTTESQVHRELASGASMPIGFKNGTDGNVKVAIDAVLAAAQPHSFLGMHKNGRIAVVRTRGNGDGHVILRGGKQPNCDRESISTVTAALSGAGLRPAVVVDASHANAGKDPHRQIAVLDDLEAQIASGSRAVMGVMIESHLVEGRQDFVPGRDDPRVLSPGQSITDACIGWGDTVAALDALAHAVSRRRV
jgi:3-deoxy-7-phosphoheptulonate synthase